MNIAFYNGVSGLVAYQQEMDLVSNNVPMSIQSDINRRGLPSATFYTRRCGPIQMRL